MSTIETPLNTTDVASTVTLKELSLAISAVLGTSNVIFVFMALTVFLILCILLIQVAFSIFILKIKPPPQPPSKIIIKRKVPSKKRDSKKSSKSSRTRVSRSAKTEPSKMLFVPVDYDARSEKKEPKKAIVVDDSSKTESAPRNLSVDPTQLTASPVPLYQDPSARLPTEIKTTISNSQALQPKQFEFQ